MDDIKWIVSVASAVISGIGSYIMAVKKSKQDLLKMKEQNKLDIEKLMNQHILNLESLEKKHLLDMAVKEKEHLHKIELIQKEHENQLIRKEKELEDTAKYNAMGNFMNNQQMQKKMMELLMNSKDNPFGKK